jgi:hypothetical protein
MAGWFRRFSLSIWVWWATWVLRWQYLSLYVPDGEEGDVVGITFTNSYAFLTEVEAIEIPKPKARYKA